MLLYIKNDTETIAMNKKYVNFSNFCGQNDILLTYIGQMGYVIEASAVRIVVDPYLSYSVDRECSNNRATWERLYAPPVSPEALTSVNFVFLSHDHLDHTDPETLRAIAAASPAAVFAASAAFSEKLEGYGIAPERIMPLHADRRVKLSPTVSVTPIPAAHEKLHPTEKGGFAELGFIFDFCGKTVYHAGDTCLYPGLSRRIERVTAAILPVNGRDAERAAIDVVGNMNIREAVSLADASGVGLMLPAHFDLYANNGESVENINSALEAYPHLDCYIPVPGETLIV